MYSVFECTHRPPLTPKHMQMLPNTLQGAPRVLWRGLGAYSGVKGSWGVWVRTQTKPSFFHVHVRTPYDPKTPSNNTSSFQYTLHACYNVSRCLVGRLCINGGLWTGRNRSYVSKIGLCGPCQHKGLGMVWIQVEFFTLDTGNVWVARRARSIGAT